MAKREQMASMVRDPKSGLFVPKEIASEAGFGCPKCGAAELVPLGQVVHNIVEISLAFRKKHENCGDLQTIEKRGGKIYVTGELVRTESIS